MRYHFIDNLRGLTFLSMAVYHTMWDLVNLYGVDAPWYALAPGYVWQQSILWLFILISGFCWGVSKRHLKRGALVFLAGALVTAVTLFALPEDPVVFGVLSFLGLVMMALHPLRKVLGRLPALPMLLICLALFVLARDIPYGYLGFEAWHIVALPDAWYANLCTALLGFQPSWFVSSDYVPFLPWVFLYLCGYFLFRLAREAEAWCGGGDAAEPLRLALPDQRPWPVVSFIGRHNLAFYLAHQVVIYAALMCIFMFVR